MPHSVSNIYKVIYDRPETRPTITIGWNCYFWVGMFQIKPILKNKRKLAN